MVRQFNLVAPLCLTATIASASEAQLHVENRSGSVVDFGVYSANGENLQQRHTVPPGKSHRFSIPIEDCAESHQEKHMIRVTAPQQDATLVQIGMILSPSPDENDCKIGVKFRGGGTASCLHLNDKVKKNKETGAKYGLLTLKAGSCRG